MRDENKPEKDEPIEIPIVGDLTDQESEIFENLLSVPEGGECTLFFNSPGGSSYSAISLLSLLVLRKIRATGIVTGECSSAALWPLSACSRRVVTPYSVLLFHPMRWQSEEGVQLNEAREWARHFAGLEQEMDALLARFLGISQEQLQAWMKPGRYVTGREFAEEGLAELIELGDLAGRRG